MLNISHLSYRIGSRVLLDDASLQIADGQKVALIGRNGAGKTTLLKLLTQDITADGGEIKIGVHQRIGTVAQEAPEGETPLLDIVLAADTERTALLQEAEIASDAHRISDIHTRLADIDAHTAPARASAILAGLGFDDVAQKKAVCEFSGGWKMRVALAAVLFSEPDILLLDEPTNHLDLEASLWLENYLIHYKRTLLFISHDRELLNKIPSRILHLDAGKLSQYTGNYDQFEQTKQEAEALQSARAIKQKAQREHMQKFVDRFRYKANKAKQAQSRIKMLERMKPITPIAGEQAVVFSLPEPSKLSPPLLSISDGAVGYADNPPILQGLNLRLDMDDRIALLGANGNGKTTLLRLLAGRLSPKSGQLVKSNKLHIGYFAQNQLDELDTQLNVLSQILSHRPKWSEREARNHLGGFGFQQEKAETKISALSGGEKARLALACICLEKPHILLLDEPTNHLDMLSRQALVQALGDYQGAVILVSHDPYLVNACADRLWLVAEGNCRSFDGDLDEYKSLLLKQRREERQAQKHQRLSDKPDVKSKKHDRKSRADARARTADLRKKAKQAERTVTALIKQKDDMEQRLIDPEISAMDISALNKQLGLLSKQIATAEEVWLSAEEAIENNQNA